MKTIHPSEEKGQKWYLQAMSYLLEKDFVSFDKHMKQAKKNYSVEYEILSCIGQLTESGKTISDIKVNLNIVKDIQLVNRNPDFYRLNTTIGEFTFSVLSDFLPLIKDIAIGDNNSRQRQCHEKAFEIAIKCPDNLYLVTGFVSVLSDIYTYLHSWIEWESGTAVLDYTLNAIMDINIYKILMNQSEPPLLRICNKDLRSGKISKDQWVKQIYNLYNKNQNVVNIEE